MYEPICEICGSQKKFVPAGISKRTGKRYEAFAVCETCKPKRQYQKAARTENDQGKMILDILDTINQRLDKMAKFLDENIEYIKDKLEVRK